MLEMDTENKIPTMALGFTALHVQTFLGNEPATKIEHLSFNRWRSGGIKNKFCFYKFY